MLKKLLFAGRLAMIGVGAAGLSSCCSDRGTIRDVIIVPQYGAAVAIPNAQTGQRRFATPEAAVDTLTGAAKAGNTNEIQAIFGPVWRDLVSPDAVQAAKGFSNFVRRVTEKVAYARQPDTNKVELQLGLEAWPFPIPLVQDKGQWFFDTAAGREEILNRRIGMNELAAIRVCRAYLEAQREYASEPRNGDGVLEYAQHFRSTTNTHDGLYWHVEAGEPPSPFGPLIVQSHDEGYRQATKILGTNLAPYRGYCFQILTRQGSHAPAGKYSYIINGHMLAGFALVAWPAEWANSGVVSFIVNQQGKVYQKNLGPRTTAIASGMTTYDPDETWRAVAEE